jgi:hypothetical protein
MLVRFLHPHVKIKQRLVPDKVGLLLIAKKQAVEVKGAKECPVCEPEEAPAVETTAVAVEEAENTAVEVEVENADEPLLTSSPRKKSPRRKKFSRKKASSRKE